MEPSESIPQLQPPGAGLPPLELFISRIGFRLLGAVISRRGASRRFRAEADRILTLARSLTPAAASRRVLVPRLAGLEDSSRYWSVFMTLEHLVIVDGAIMGAVAALASGVVPPGTASTAAAKPAPTADATAIDRFEAAARDYLARTDDITDLRTKVRYPHPWFGPLNALNWHRLAALHHRIHRKQLESIVERLPRAA